MDKNFFGQQVERLKAVYSHGLPQERVQLLWDRFKGVENRVFENAINFLIGEHTSQTLPAMSKFAEAMSFFKTKTNAHINHAPPAFDCEPCRDFGYGFIGDTLVACTCSKRVGPAELVKQQHNYDKGRKLLPNRAALPAFMKGDLA